MNALNNFDKTYREYLLAPADELKVKVTASHQGGKGIHVDAAASKSTVF